MRTSYFIATVLLVAALSSALPATPEDDFFGEDKAKHFVYSALLTGLTSYAVSANRDNHSHHPMAVGISVTMGLGFLKEVRDSRQKGNHFCFRDLTWDMLGATFGALNYNLLRNE